METLTEKSRLRAEMAAQRKAIPPEEQADAAAKLAAQAEDYLRQCGPVRLAAGYHPVRGELSPLPLMEALRAKDIALALPRLNEVAQRLDFRLWTPDMLLEPNCYGIAEPPETAEPVLPDLILTPLLAFDRRGGRLGYGGGWYDRTLAALQKKNHPFRAIGVAYDWQEVLETPSEPHDQPLSTIITPREWIKIPSQSSSSATS